MKFKVIDTKTGKEADILTADHTYGLSPQGKLFYVFLDNATFQQGERYAAEFELFTAEQLKAIEEKIAEELRKAWTQGTYNNCNYSETSKATEIMKLIKGE